jgi:hypothetical protein
MSEARHAAECLALARWNLHLAIMGPDCRELSHRNAARFFRAASVLPPSQAEILATLRAVHGHTISFGRLAQAMTNE